MMGIYWTTKSLQNNNSNNKTGQRRKPEQRVGKEKTIKYE